MNYKFAQNEDEIQVQRWVAADRGKKEIFDLLETSQQILQLICTESNFKKKNDCQSFQKALEGHISALKKWIEDLLVSTVDFIEKGRAKEDWPVFGTIPSGVSKRLLRCIAEVISCGKEFEDNDFYLLNRLRNFLSLDRDVSLKIIDSVSYDNKKHDVERLVQRLDPDQRLIFASMLYKAIQADEILHPAEMKYLQNISQLLGNDEAALELVEKEGLETDHIPALNLEKPYADYLFTQLVEIVMCDDEFDPKESDFLDKTARALGIGEIRKEQVKHSVATSMIAKSTLFHESDD